jgi:hypothetical protein
MDTWQEGHGREPMGPNDRDNIWGSQGILPPGIPPRLDEATSQRCFGLGFTHEPDRKARRRVLIGRLQSAVQALEDKDLEEQNPIGPRSGLGDATAWNEVRIEAERCLNLAGAIHCLVMEEE